ncbi:MAG: carbohydrate kinase family protein [Microgenomates group bacterium]
MYDVISLGAATVDIFVKSDGLTLDNGKLTIPYSSKYETSDSLICSGGGATNSAVALSRLGLKTSCVSLLGNDPLSLFIFNDLKENNVSTDSLVHLNKEDTDYSVILVGPDGGRTIITNRGQSRLEKEQMNWDKLAQTSWFYITSLEGNLDLIEQLVGFASEHNIKIALNPGNRELADSRRLVPLLSRIDFLLLNGLESESLTGIHVNEGNYWQTLLGFGAKVTAVTNGRQGAYVLTADEKLYSPIINTTPIDETGAGDSFGSAFVGALLNHFSNSDSLFWAIKNAASVVSSLGAKTGLLTLAQIKQ